MGVLSPEELSASIGVPVRTLEQWRYQGVGPVYTKAGKRVLYLESDITAWLERNRVATEINAA